MSNGSETKCYHCHKLLSSSSPHHAMMASGWHMRNIAPNAASGGTMVAVCDECDPLPIFPDAIDAANLSVKFAALQRSHAALLKTLEAIATWDFPECRRVHKVGRARSIATAAIAQAKQEIG